MTCINIRKDIYNFINSRLNFFQDEIWQKLDIIYAQKK